MIRKLVIASILISMLLHCLCRIGFLSFLYQQRHEIAYTIGLIAEVPVSICGNNYLSSDQLVIQTQTSDQSNPPSFLQTREILLFFDYQPLDSPEPPLLMLIGMGNTLYRSIPILDCLQDIFQPPRF